MNSIYRAYVDSPSFSFEAYGHSRKSALTCLRQGLFKHAERFSVHNPKAWVDEVAADANVIEYKIGFAYRDRELIK